MIDDRNGPEKENGTSKQKCRMWQPRRRASEPIPIWAERSPEGAILMTLEDRYEAMDGYVDEAVLARALARAGWLDRCVEKFHERRTDRECDRIVNYWIEYEHDGETTTLDAGRVEERTMPARAPKGRASRISVFVTLVPVQGTERLHELPVDVAITDPSRGSPEKHLIVLSEDTGDLPVDTLMNILESGLFYPADKQDYERNETQETEFRNRAHETATDLLLERGEARKAQIVRALQATGPQLKNNETVNVRMTRDGTAHTKYEVAVARSQG